MEEITTIAKARIKNNHSLEDVSTYLNVSVDTLKTYEMHPEDTPIRDAVLLADLFGINIKKIKF